MNIFTDYQANIGRSAIVALLLLPALGMQSAYGHEYTAQIKAKKYAEVTRAISVRLAADANNADALLAKIDLILIEGKVSRLDEAVRIAEQCIANNPRNSECHEALGNVMGTKADKGGMLTGLGSLGTIRDSFKTAIALDPKNFSAASSLLTFYLEVPGFMGGSTSKANDLIVQTNKLSPAAASLLQAEFDLKDDNIEKARTEALAVNANGTPALAELQNDVLLQIGQTLAQKKNLVEAKTMFQEVAQRFPDSSAAYLGLGRVLEEQGKHSAALPQLEKSLSIDPSAAAFYQIGKVWQALGDKTKAIASFEKSLAFSPELGTKSRADAEEQLKTLKHST